jgi:hypothetical protein
MEKSLKVFHADHGVSEDTLTWALSQIEGDGFFLITLTLPEGHADLLNGLYGPIVGDAPITDSEVHFTRRSEDRPLSRMVARPKRPTRLLTLIGTRTGDAVVVYTAHGGPAAEREPGDKSLATDAERAASDAFWQAHALASAE